MSNETLYRNIFATIMLVTIIVGYDVAHTPTEIVRAQNSEVVVPTPTPTVELTTEVHKEVLEDTPENYIREVFGKHADKAFLLLKGDGAGSCAENRMLDQNAKNRNWIKGKPGEYWSTDWGIFQINDRFHPVTELNLKDDWKANIRYAKKMFDNDGETFSKRWTCGKYYFKLGYEI